MRTSLLLSSLLVLLHHSLPLVVAVTPEEACTQAASKSKVFNLKLCVDSLKSDPLGSISNPSLEDLTAAAVQQSLLKDQAAWNQAVAIRARFPNVGHILDMCATTYKDLQDTIQSAGFLLQNDIKGPARKEARGVLVGARDRSSKCPKLFRAARKDSPIAKESSDVTDMIQIAIAMLDILPPATV